MATNFFYDEINTYDTANIITLEMLQRAYMDMNIYGTSIIYLPTEFKREYACKFRQKKAKVRPLP